MSMSTNLRATVFQALNTALEGGYTELRLWPADDLARDLLAFSPDHEDSTFTDLLPHCDAWLAVNGINPL
jgi:hypothetical protein